MVLFIFLHYAYADICNLTFLRAIKQQWAKVLYVDVFFTCEVNCEVKCYFLQGSQIDSASFQGRNNVGFNDVYLLVYLY
jgi:hypothetical protein